jgi:hypothetical protein
MQLPTSGSSRVVARGYSRVVAGGNSRIVAGDDSYVVAFGHSHVEAFDSAYVLAGWDTSVYIHSRQVQVDSTGTVIDMIEEAYL